MRKGFVRFLAGVLTTTLLFSFRGYTGYAIQEKRGSLGTVFSEMETTAETDIETEIDTETEVDAKTVSPAAVQFSNTEGTLIRGSLEVMITAGIEVKKDQKFQVSLKKDGREYLKEVTLAGSEGIHVSRISARFSDLEEGTYQLVVSGKGYIRYEQKIKVENYLGYRVQIYTGKEAQICGENQPGLLRCGDIVEDGLLDKKDGTAIVDAIDTGNKDGRYDLNGDGKVDLLDLNYFTEFLGKRQKTATVEKLLPVEAIVVALVENTEVGTGSIERMLTGEGEVSLSYGAEKEMITEKTPVVVDFDFSKSKEAMKMEGMIMKPPKDGEGAMEEGVVIISYEDENGKLQSVTVSISAPNDGQTPRITMGSGIGAVGALVSWQGNDICINFGGQIAVKKVTLRITKTSGIRNLAKISSVEFINDMESRIPDPVRNVPTDRKAVSGNK